MAGSVTEMRLRRSVVLMSRDLSTMTRSGAEPCGWADCGGRVVWVAGAIWSWGGGLAGAPGFWREVRTREDPAAMTRSGAEPCGWADCGGRVVWVAGAIWSWGAGLAGVPGSGREVRAKEEPAARSHRATAVKSVWRNFIV